MLSNGFGSFKQKIILRFDLSDAEAVENTLGASPFKKDDQSAYFEWNRTSRTKGDDETVVYEAGHIFEEICSAPWEIVWSESKY